MTHQTLDKAKKLSDEMIEWRRITQMAYNQVLSMSGHETGVEYLRKLASIMSVDEYNALRDLLTTVATNKLNNLQKEFDEL
jgi:hypothetical protein